MKHYLFFIPDKLFIKIEFRINMGYKLNLKNPQTFSEKLQWLKLYNRKPEYTQMVDKIEVKKYIANIIGEQYIIPTLGEWDNADDIDFDKLPNKFVLKCTHTAGGSVFICKDKSTFDIDGTRRKLNKQLNRSMYHVNREHPYKNVNRRILAEKYMINEGDEELKDYKFFCFDGSVECCQVIANRTSNKTVDFYNKNWESMGVTGLDIRRLSTSIHKQPDNYANMLEIASKLSTGHKFLRVDLYYINSQIYFGELTFFPNSGMGFFEPKKWNKIFGDKIKI